ncbi:MAG: hypothetical protein H7Y12_08750 [Sphingobacteriaceae bacterium]|nr:hypothetical protein [Cytophagaceae bacterium]
MANSATDSLPLYKILEEEHTYLSGQKTRSDEVFPLKEGSSFAREESIKLNGVNKLLARVAAQKPEESNSDWPLRETNRQRRAAKAEYPYARLAGWIQADPDSRNLEPENASDRIEKVLLEKINTDTKTLLDAEPWLRDSALRPYTRGLLKSYFDQGQHVVSKAEGGKVLASGFPGLWASRQNEPWPAEKLRYLNRLLIEDAFTEYIQSDETARLRGVLDSMRNDNQAALCLSGGGIRSATFALGVLQGLARLDNQSKAGESSETNALWNFDYLSTVSGGGYLGGWLSAWTHQVGFGHVIDQLRGVRHDTDTPLEPEATPLRHLRQYSNYLSPRLGLFSADTWTLISTYLRNLLLVWLVILPFLAAVAALPWLVVTLTEFDGWRPAGQMNVFYGLLAIAMGLMTYGLFFVHAYLPQVESSAGRSRPVGLSSKRDQGAFLVHCLLPITFATLLWMLAWRWYNNWDLQISWLWYAAWGSTKTGFRGLFHSINRDTLLFVVGGALVHLVAWGSSLVTEYLDRMKIEKASSPASQSPTSRKKSARVLIFLFIVVTGGVGGFLLQRMGMGLILLASKPHAYLYTCLAFPSVFLTILLVGYLLEGAVSRFVEDAQREWTARYGAWILIFALGWLVLTGLVLGGPVWIAALGEHLRLAAGGVGVGSAILTALLGRSSKTGGEGEGAGSRRGMGNVRDLVGLLSSLTLPLVATITILALFIALSALNMAFIGIIADWLGYPVPSMDRLTVPKVVRIPPWVPLLVLSALLLLGFASAWLVNTNRFSLHALYRARLIRAYLGASRPLGERKPDPFTGFDDADNPLMGDLVGPPLQPGTDPRPGPFHVINMALNLVAGQNLAWQERMAESFTISCLHAGATHLGYRRTSISGQTDALVGKLYGGDRGISLGTAMTISGAAASPNMGYHSSPVIAFLMTLFNIRLGWWLGNPSPAGDDTFYRAEPGLAVRPIFDELLANTDDVNPYVYLSDGGHFENLGLYEMVLRRNRFILVSDAGCDETCTLEDLGNAIRKIRIDLGIPIDFSEDFKIRARSSDQAAPAGRYWALGRIRYSCIDRPTSSDDDSDTDYDGLLLYIKPGIYGNEPRDVFNYASANPAFPHESTSDQFFSESQFESYRALGAHAVHRIGDELGMPLEKLFDRDVRKAILESGSWTSLPFKPPTAGPGEVRA